MSTKLSVFSFLAFFGVVSPTQIGFANALKPIQITQTLSGKEVRSLTNKNGNSQKLRIIEDGTLDVRENEKISKSFHFTSFPKLTISQLSYDTNFSSCLHENFSGGSKPSTTIQARLKRCWPEQAAEVDQGVGVNFESTGRDLEQPQPMSLQALTPSPISPHSQLAASSALLTPLTDASIEPTDTPPFEFLQAQAPDTNEANENESPDPEEPPDPEGLEFGDGEFLLEGAIRRLTILELQLRSSVLTDPGILTSALGRDVTFYNSVNLVATPELIPNTFLDSSVGGYFTRFVNGGGYDSVITNLGIRQKLTANMSLGLGWRYQSIDGRSVGPGQPLGDLSEHSAVLKWNRADRLTNKLTLFSSYEGQVNVAENENQTRITNTAGLTFSLQIIPKLYGSAGYRLVNNNFFERDAINGNPAGPSDLYHEFSGQIFYQINEKLFVSTSLSYLFGSQLDLIRANPANGPRPLNETIFGLQIGFNLPLF